MTLQSMYGSDKDIIIQRFLNNGGVDERHIVVNGKVVSSMERRASKDDVRSNLSQSGTGKKIIADSETRELCIQAVAAINGLNFAGVDIMKDTNGKPYVIEINSNPGAKIIEITGYNHFTDLVKFCEDNYRKGTMNTLISEQLLTTSPNTAPKKEDKSSDFLEWQRNNPYYKSIKEALW